MVNFWLTMSSWVGIALAVSGAGLYFLRTVRPNLARDYDIFFSAVGLLCGGILLFQGWRQDPILQFGQFMLAGTAIWFAYEAVRLRGVTTEQAKRSTPVIDDERPVSRVYRAELDDFAPMDERPITRRIKGTRDPRPSSDYGEEGRRRPSSSSTSSSRSGTERERLRPSSDRVRRRRPSDSSGRPDTYSSDRYNDNFEERSVWDDEPENKSSSYTSYGSSSRPENRSSDPPARPRRPRPSSASRRSPRSESSNSDYVDYQPINYSDSDSRNSSNFE
jgi:Ycf66 protein N-terminus